MKKMEGIKHFFKERKYVAKKEKKLLLKKMLCDK